VIQTPVINNWAAGELDDKTFGRSDLPFYHAGAQVLENFLITEQAILTKRPGTEYVGAAYGNTNKPRLIPFVYNDTESYIVELTNGYLRVWRNGDVVATTSSPTYTAAQIWDIHYCQDNNGIYFAHNAHAPAALVRTATDTFSFGSIVFIYNVGATYTSHATGNVADDEDFVVQEAIGASVPQQGSFSVEYDVGKSDEYTYTSWATSTFSGVSPALRRTYDGGDSLVIGHKFHADGSTTPFGGASKYPRTIAIIGGRFWFGGTNNEPQRAWGSETYEYLIDSGTLYVDLTMYETVTATRQVLKPDAEWAVADEPETEAITYVREIITDSNAIDIEIASDKSDAIYGMSSAKHLVINTAAAEWVIPHNISARTPAAELMTRYGSNTIQPKLVRDSMLFLQGDGKKVREYQYTYERQGYVSPNLTRYADHVCGATGVVQFDYQQEPYSVAYFVRADGELAVLTYERAANVLAWQRWILGDSWTWISVAVIPESGDDVVYAAVHDGTNYYIVKLTDPFPATQGLCEFADACYDVTADPLTLVSGNTVTCSWLANDTVALIVDGEHVTDLSANGSGVIDFSGYSGTQMYVGLAFTSKYRSMPSPVVKSTGSGANQDKRVNALYIRLYHSLDIQAGFNTWDTAETETKDLGSTWSDDIIALPFSGNYDKEACINIVSEKAEPTTVTSIVPRTEIA